MFRRFLPPLLLIPLMLILSIPTTAGNGVDELRGRWDVIWLDCQDCLFPQVRLFIDEIQPADEPDAYLANGCIFTSDSKQYAPLSLKAIDLGQGLYDLTILGTIIPQDQEPYVIRLAGNAMMVNQGVSDDQAAGDWVTELGDGFWAARHHDRRNPHCPPASEVLEWERDVFASRNVGQWPFVEIINLEGRAPIVSSGLLVTAPDGEVFDLPPFDDIFSPEVDFISHFRYQQEFRGRLPIAGEPYNFVLLDIFGNPIPGTEGSDTWYACIQDAPHNLVPNVLSNPPDIDFNFVYDGFRDTAGGFNPAEWSGTYKISIYPRFEGGDAAFGSHFISEGHRVPWETLLYGDFGPGYPDGDDFGQALSQMPNGRYEVAIEAVSDPPEGSAGLRNECFVTDVNENLYMVKEDDQFDFTQSGSVSGQVVAQDSGTPLVGIFIEVCEYQSNEPMCWGGITAENGTYRVGGVLPGIYRVRAASDQGWATEFFAEQPDFEMAGEVTVNPMAETTDINFTLELGGSISGRVTDEAGNPLAGIGVDIEQGGYGTCTDENGEYHLWGFAIGEYNAVAGRDFCGPHSYVEMVQTGIILDEVTPDIGGVDFTLPLGGSISGRVTDEAGNPLVNIGVDIEQGDYGRCTDEYGEYRIPGLPLGEYDVVAGRDFCGPHGYIEMLQTGIILDETTPDVGGVDFVLPELPTP